MLERSLQRELSGGIRIRARKAVSTGAPIARGLLPRRLVIPMAQHAGPEAVPVVEVGQRVRKGELIGRPAGMRSGGARSAGVRPGGARPGGVRSAGLRSGGVRAAGMRSGGARSAGVPASSYVNGGTDQAYLRSAGVHASTSGTVSAIDEGPAPTVNGLTTSLCVHLESDGKDDPAPSGAWPGEREARIDAIRSAGIVGLGGAVFSTAEKLRGDTGCELLILNGAECEPYISCDDMLMREHPLEVVRGALAMMDLVGAESTVFAVERDKPDALRAVREAAAQLGDARIEFARVPTVYPAGGERQLVEALTGREVPSGGYPPAAGCVCQNVGTAFALDRFIRRGKPLTSRVVTVTGSGVANAANVEVPIGTSIRDLIEFCGGYRGEVARLILGGNMMGYALPGDDVPITKACNCIVAAHSEEVRETFGEWPCIRCGDCAEVCPPRLLPQELLRAAEVRDFDRLDTLGLNDCIECGCCDVACPSQIALTERFRRVKQARAVALRRAAMAELADKRHRRKLARLAAQSEETDRQQDNLIAAIGSGDGRAMIEAAVARADRRRGDDRSGGGAGGQASRRERNGGGAGGQASRRKRNGRKANGKSPPS